MSENYLNPSLPPEDRAAALLEEMSLDEKMAQVNSVFPFEQIAQDFDAIRERTAHGIGTVSTLSMRAIETLEDAAAWQRRVQELSLIHI